MACLSIIPSIAELSHHYSEAPQQAKNVCDCNYAERLIMKHEGRPE